MIVHSYYPVGEVRAEREARAAVEADYAVDVICLQRPHEAQLEIVDDIRITRLPVQHIRGAGALRSIGEYIRFALQATAAVLKIHRKAPVDVVYVHAPPDFLIVTALIPKVLGSRVVLDIHDLSPHMFDARFGRGRLAKPIERVLRAVERGACSVADRVVTVHDPYRDELAAHGVPSDKIAVVMNAPLTESVELARTAAANGQHSGSFVVAYHGTVTHWYGVDLMVEAIARLEDRIPNLRGLILGEGDALPAAEALAHRAGVASRIEFPSTLVSQAEAVRRVAGASCGVIPNRDSRLNRFALSSKLLEYVALDIPVVVSRLETLAAHFGSDEVTFFDPGDVESLAEAIGWVAEHPAEAREKTERARRRAEAYSWAASRARLLETLSSTAAARRRSMSRPRRTARGSRS
jgi:glycosyltransferase involved in cell wall biosynthesis